MERVLTVYRRPLDPLHPMVCMDETPRQLIAETCPAIPAAPGRPQRHDYEYERRGTYNVFMASEPLAGRRMMEVTWTKTKKDRAHFIDKIAGAYPDAKRITLVMDNLNTHTAGSLYETFAPEKAKWLMDRFEFIHTPRHGSWLNMAEIELNVMIGQCLRRHIATLEEVRQELAAWEKSRNAMQAKVNWRFTTEDARVKLKRLYPTFDV